MRIDEVLQFWEEEGALTVGSRFHMPGMNGSVDVVEIQDPGGSGEGYLTVRVRDTASRRQATWVVVKAQRASA